LVGGGAGGRDRLPVKIQRQFKREMRKKKHATTGKRGESRDALSSNKKEMTEGTKKDMKRKEIVNRHTLKNFSFGEEGGDRTAGPAWRAIAKRNTIS